MVVLGDIQHLATTDAAFTAVPQFFQSRGGWRINSGVMSFDRSVMTDEFVERMDEIGRTGAYDLERHDQGILSAVLDGEYTKLDNRYNLVKRAVKRGQLPPEDTRIFHFTGSIKPWSGGEVDYADVEELWAQYDLPAALFWRQGRRGAAGGVGGAGLLRDPCRALRVSQRRRPARPAQCRRAIVRPRRFREVGARSGTEHRPGATGLGVLLARLRHSAAGGVAPPGGGGCAHAGSDQHPGWAGGIRGIGHPALDLPRLRCRRGRGRGGTSA